MTKQSSQISVSVTVRKQTPQEQTRFRAAVEVLLAELVRQLLAQKEKTNVSKESRG